MTRKLSARICFIIDLTLLSFAVVAVILLLCGERAEEICVGGDILAFAPVYNRSGSWFHARLGIGYRPDILLLEHVISMLLLVYLSRFMDFTATVLKINTLWSRCLDFGMAATLVRLITALFGRYTLNYIYIAPLRSTYDLPDLYLGVSLAVLLIWAVWCEVRYLRLKKSATRGMGFAKRMKWELLFTGNVLKAAILPAARWEEIRRPYEIWDDMETAG